MRTRKTVVILVSGKAGSGKSTVSDMLVAKIKDIPSLTVMPYGFADPIKYIAKSFFKWDGNKDEKGRKLLQQIGAVGREYDQDIWVKHFLAQLENRAGLFPFNFSVVSDWRFPNEYNYLNSNPLLNVVTVRVFGRGGLDGATASDVSENSLLPCDVEVLSKEGMDNQYYDYQIDNSVSREDLEKKVDAVLSEISSLYIVE